MSARFLLFLFTLSAAALEIPEGAKHFKVEGRQFLEKPLVLTERHSNLTIEGAGANATLSGGRILKGFKVAPDGLWELNVGEKYFRQLFVNGRRATRARTPNDGFFRIQGESPQDKPIKLKFKPGDIKPEWAADGDVEVVGFLAWADIRMQIRAVDGNVATLSGDPRPSNKEANARYFIENAPDALDAPGEWHLNRKTGILRYKPLPGENPDTTEVIAPVLEELVTVRGATNVIFRNLTFAHTDYTLGTNGLADTQAAIAVRGDLLFEFAKDCLIENCKFIHLAGYAVEAGRGAQGIKIRRCEMRDLGGGGVRFGETAKRDDPREASHSHEITDSHLHQLGRIFAPAVGVFILQSATNRVAHNRINDLYYTAVSVGWNWGYQETPCRENIVESNHMHDIGQAMLSDMGAVYTLGIQKGTIIRNNLIHDVSSFTYGGWGLYPDEGSTDIVWENNVVYRCKSAGFHQHYGRDNIVRNNIFAYNKEHQLMRTREEAHNSFTFERNIVIYETGELLGSNWSNNNFRMDHNLYYKLNGQPTFKGQSFERWQARGHDKNSIIANPELTEDYQLKPTSPALKLGFKPIGLSKVGPRR